MPKTRGKSTAGASTVPPTVTGTRTKVQAQSLDSDPLSAEFNDLLDRLQTPAARKALKSAFAAKPKTLGRLAAAPKKSV